MVKGFEELFVLMKKILFLMIFLLYSNQSNACKIDTSSNDLLKSDPAAAKTSSIGRVEEINNDRFFISQAPWPKLIIPLQIFGLGMSNCGGADANAGETYYLASSLDFKNAEDKKKKIDYSNGAFIKLRDLSRRLPQLFELEEFPKGQSNVLWGNCQSNDECVKFDKKCDEKINKKYVLSYKKYLEKNKKKCRNSTAKIKYVPKCVENFCS